MIKRFLTQILFAVGLFFGLYLVALFYTSFQNDLIIQDISRDYEAGYILLEALKPGIPSEQWEKVLQEVSTKTNIPAESRSINDWHLSPEGYALVNKGEIYVADTDTAIAYKKIDNNTVVRLGPITTIKELERAELIMLAIFLAFILLYILAWVCWHHYKVRKLINAIEDFSSGNLNRRAPLGFREYPFLSKSFNQLAERIQRLFLSHKNLSNAVAHELRSPISRLRFQLEIVNQTSLLPDQQQLLIKMSNNLDEIDGLVEESLRYARLERSEFSADLRSVALSIWIKERTQSLEQDIEIPLTLTIPDRHYKADIDTLLMARLLQNLVVNAGRYANTEIHIEVQFDEQHWVVSVSDDGIGIPIKDREKIFEPFVRLDPSRTRETGGHGLGLAIVTQIVRCHQGSISVNSSESGGSCFRCRFPKHLNDATVD